MVFYKLIYQVISWSCRFKIRGWYCALVEIKFWTIRFYNKNFDNLISVSAMFK